MQHKSADFMHGRMCDKQASNFQAVLTVNTKNKYKMYKIEQKYTN